MLIKRETTVSTPKNKQNAPASGSESRTRKRKEDKLIRLDDLIPKKNVAGGRQLLFGVTDTRQKTNNPTKKN
jgi:hypothetical protein